MSFDPNKITFFARTDARGKDVQFGIKAKDRQRHVYVIGKTGMGKSTLLENMAVQDIQNGEGMAFIDPHGSAAETLLNYIPEHRINDVLYFAPFDTDNPVSFNIMEDVGPDKRHLVVSGLMSVFKKIWIDAWSARMEYILSNTLLALLEYPDSTLLGVNRMLSDKDYRKLVVDNVKDPGVKAFWVDEFAKYNERYMQEAGDAIKNKIGQFTANPIIRNIIGQPKSSFNIREMMDQKKILIMNLSKGLIGESNANLLGSMLTTRIYLAAMSRADVPPEKMRDMPNFYFYVDEFQSFANATFANILSEARKYHLNLTIAHQYIEQMEEEVRNAVFGNVGTIISFRVGPFDAEVLETIFSPQFLATDIVNLSFAQIYLTLMIDGIGSQPFSATTLPPIAPPVASCKEMAIAASRKRFTVSRGVAEDMIHKFHEPVVIPKKTNWPSPDTAPKSRTVEEKNIKPNRTSSPTPHTTFKESVEVRRERIIEAYPVEPVAKESPKAVVPVVIVQNAKAVPHSVSKVHEKNTPQIRNEQQGRDAHRERKSYQQPHGAVDISKQPSTEDLRALLRKLVATPEGKESVIEKPKREPEKKRDTTSLKAILQATLATEKKDNSSHEVTNNGTYLENSSVSENTAEYKKTPVEESHAPKVHAVQSTHTPTFEEKKDMITNAHEGKQPAVTPKELERMMRVTTNDKPPV